MTQIPCIFQIIIHLSNICIYVYINLVHQIYMDLYNNKIINLWCLIWLKTEYLDRFTSISGEIVKQATFFKKYEKKSLDFQNKIIHKGMWLLCKTVYIHFILRKTSFYIINWIINIIKVFIQINLNTLFMENCLFFG